MSFCREIFYLFKWEEFVWALLNNYLDLAIHYSQEKVTKIPLKRADEWWQKNHRVYECYGKSFYILGT